MAESQQHRDYVVSIVNWINAERDPHSKLVVLSDDGVGGPQSKPQKINDHFPDVFAKAPGAPAVIVGEAKTADDLERSHSERQIAAFVAYINAVGGGTLVVAVPWFRATSARELINYHVNALNAKNCEGVVLEQLE